MAKQSPLKKTRKKATEAAPASSYWQRQAQEEAKFKTERYHVFIPVTAETGPAALVADARKWTRIGENYYQSDTVKGICLEISRQRDGQFRWFIYDETTADPDVAVVLADKPTLEEALADALDYLSG